MKPVDKLSWNETVIELDKVFYQFKVVHDLPELDKIKPNEYMEAALEGIRKRAIEIHWRRIEIIKRKTRGKNE